MKQWTTTKTEIKEWSLHVHRGGGGYERPADVTDIGSLYRAQSAEDQKAIMRECGFKTSCQLCEEDTQAARDRADKAEARVRDFESAGAGLRLVLLKRKLEEAEKRVRELEHYETEAKRKWEDRQQLRKEEDPSVPGAYWYTREVGGEEVVSVHCMNAWKRKALAADDARSANATLREKLNAAETELVKVKLECNGWANRSDQADERIKKLEAEIGAYKPKLVDLEHTTKQLRESNAQVREQRDRLGNKIVALRRCLEGEA